MRREAGLCPDFNNILSFAMPPRIPAKMAQAVSAILSRMRTRLRSARQLRKDTRCLRRIIRSEPKPGRRILELYFIERCPIDDIAIRLDLSPETVRRHLLRAIRRFEEESGS
ncbi:MAG: sigma factor-like helix-turn-helix DNA-binding protein [Sphingobium sp.]